MRVKLYDITMPLAKGMPVWPDDTPFAFELTASKQTTLSVNIGKLTMSTHTGTHVDAPYHFVEHGQKAAGLEIERFVGPALVIDLSGREKIDASVLLAHPLERVPRLLVKTNSWANRSVFPKQICHLDPDVAPLLAKCGVKLIGVDVPSVDPIDSKELPAHHALLAHDISILEGIVLDDVPPGWYELIALPLRLQEADASPVRAVLRPLG